MFPTKFFTMFFLPPITFWLILSEKNFREHPLRRMPPEIYGIYILSNASHIDFLSIIN